MNQNKTPLLIHTVTVSLLFICSLIIIPSIGFMMVDDGWRHLAMATMPNDVVSWGRVYQNSLFTDYDPWFMWHNLLRFFGQMFGNENIYLIINVLMYFFLSLWYYLAFNKFSNMNRFFIIFLSIVLPIISFRYFNLRPEVLSGFFVLYATIYSSTIFIFFISIMYAPFYYVYWFFMGYMGYIKLITKEFKPLLAICIAFIIGTVFHLYYDFDGFIHILKLVLNNDELRGGYSVGESYPIVFSLDLINNLGSSTVLIFLMVFSILLYLIFKPQNKFLQYTILFLPLLIIQVRFYYILEPIVIAFISTFLYHLYFDIAHGRINEILFRIKHFIDTKTLFGRLGVKFYHGLAILIISIYGITHYIAYKELSEELQDNFDRLVFLSEDEYKGKNIFLLNMNYEMQIMLYQNPTATYFPSCALGWTNINENMKDVYFRLMYSKKIGRDEFFDLVKLHNADYIILVQYQINKYMTINTQEFRDNGYEFYKIINGYVIFKKINS